MDRVAMALTTILRPPAGYSLLPFGMSCRCPKRWTDGLQDFCCGGRAEQDTAIADRERKIEALARAMCAKDGYDPEALVFSGPAQVLMDGWHLVPSHTCPAWVAYRLTARRALECLDHISS
jgi:hypothetical protein